MADYRFARRPAWLAGHVLVVSLVLLMVALGFWQLRRLDQRRADNDLIEARSAMAPVAVGDFLDPGDEGRAVDELRFRAVALSGTYTGGGTVVRSTQDGASGGRVFSVLDIGGGESVAVLRGFVRQQPDGSASAPGEPEGPVEVVGLAVPRANLELLSRQALDDIGDEAPGLLPVIVQAAESGDPSMVPVPPPELDDGPHLSYAVQWFLFAAVGVVGYPLLLRRRARENQGPPP